MFRSRVGGIILGILIGFIPLINTCVCVVLSFVQRRSRLGIFFLLLAGIIINSIIITRNIDIQKGLINELWEPAFYRNLESANLQYESRIDRNFEQSMFSVLDKTTQELMQQHEELKKLFKIGRSGEIAIDNDVYHVFKTACRSIFYSYWDKVESETGERSERGARNVSFGKTKEEQEYIREQLNVFFREYVDYKLKFKEGFNNMLIGLGFLFSLVGSIALGRHMFDTAEDPVTTIDQVSYNTSAVLPDVIPGASLALDINVNTADERELTRLPGINQVLAKGIISERRRNGYFADIFDMEQRMGFTEEMIASLMFATSFEVTGAPERREEQDKKDKKDDKGKDRGTGRGRVIEF
ncbi:helix-hairpin-helix domain-containing protein [Chitinophaga sp. HK235]|uniref:ComEA family DNA-binding protein n=1 Tax=Chitinophaga sp. HK235 TaxID=2952571 RepID=UPI001BAC0FBA|nr:helix-hairpin-helix domain-containing protein [Chitinophaga sp. HK235]